MIFVSIGCLHLILGLCISIYPFIFTKSRFDYIFLLYTFSVVILWTYFNGECFIAYLVKKYKDPSYISGSNIKHEISYIYPSLDTVIFLITKCVHILWMYSFYIVMTRNKYPVYITISFIFIWLTYLILQYTFTNLHENKTFHLYQQIIYYCLIIILGFAIYYTKLV